MSRRPRGRRKDGAPRTHRRVRSVRVPRPAPASATTPCAHRQIGRSKRVAAIGTFTDPLKSAIKALKYGGRTEVAPLLGQLVLGWLERNLRPGEVDLIVPNPTWSGRDAPDRRHTERVINAAAALAPTGRWPFDHQPWAVTKPCPTPRSAYRSWAEKRAIARLHAASLTVDSRRVAGRRVLVYDDVATTLFTQDHVARRLLEAGATSVIGLVAARAKPLQPPTVAPPTQRQRTASQRLHALGL